MGNFFGAIVLLVSTATLLLFWLGTGKHIFIKALGVMYLGLLILFLVAHITSTINAKKDLTKEDYYGEYVINRAFFSGRQADWQYNTFHFEIKSNDSIYFYVTDKAKVLQTFKGAISTVKPYDSERLIIKMAQPTYHVLTSNPTTHRNSKTFYLVFNSPHFGNMYFKKGHRE